jgi:uncharacterized protein (TIGR00255 family)
VLLSMTGHGEARRESRLLTATVEVRTINSRYYKLNLRGGESIMSLESRIDTVVRKHVRRGGVTVNLRIDREVSLDDYRFNAAVLLHFRREVDKLSAQQEWAERATLSDLLTLPGVVSETSAHVGFDDEQWAVVEQALEEALTKLTRMREQEGQAMARDLSDNCGQIATELAAIEQRAPVVVESYRQRITDRIGKLMTEHGVSLQPGDLVREAAIFAEKTDISEEIVRLKSHLSQFDAFIAEKESSGRKLDFLTQEIFREANTIGSKANDLDIGRRVIEMKAAIERIREMVQNVE